jgi:hypothetical protein
MQLAAHPIVELSIFQSNLISFFVAEENLIVGNVALYGATSGEVLVALRESVYVCATLG